MSKFFFILLLKKVLYRNIKDGKLYAVKVCYSCAIDINIFMKPFTITHACSMLQYAFFFWYVRIGYTVMSNWLG